MPETKKRTWIETLGMFGNLRSGADKPHRKIHISRMLQADHRQDRKVDKNQLAVLEQVSRKESRLFPYNQADKDKVKKELLRQINCLLKCKYLPSVISIRV